MSTQTVTVAGKRRKVGNDVTLVPAASIEALIETIRHEHDLVVRAGRKLLEHAVLCGNALREIRARVERGKWTVWCESHLPFSQQTAATYIRLSLYADLLRDEQVETVTAALQFLREHGLSDSGDSTTDEQIARIAILRRRGLTPSQIADAMGIPRSVVRGYLEDPTHGERRRRRLNQAEGVDRIRLAPRKRGRRKIDRIAITDDLIEGAALKLRELFGPGTGVVTDEDREVAVEVLRAAFTYEVAIPTVEARLGEVSADQAAEIMRLQQSGLSVLEVAAHLHCSPRSLATQINRLRRAGYDVVQIKDPASLPKHPPVLAPPESNAAERT